MKRLLLPGSLLLLAACSGDDALPPQPAPPPDRNFTATVNQRPVVGGTQSYLCLLNRENARRQPQYLLTFTDDLGHSIQVGIEAADGQPGPRAVLSGMALAEGHSYGLPRNASAELTLIDRTALGAVVSGRFSATFDLAANSIGGDKTPLTVTDAYFDQVECSDPVLARAAQAAH